eukprot:6213391-Pleurochrysis_carterae.AAC.2
MAAATIMRKEAALWMVIAGAGLCVASLITLISRSRYLLQSLAFSIAASVRDDTVVRIASYSLSTRLHREDKGQRVLWITVPPCVRNQLSKNTKETRNGA